jgi:hypothetical protein
VRVVCDHGADTICHITNAPVGQETSANETSSYLLPNPVRPRNKYSAHVIKVDSPAGTFMRHYPRQFG